MTQALAGPKLYTPAEYLALEDKSRHKHEYFDGEIRAMAGASYNHNVISFNLSGLLYNTFLQSNCQAFAINMKVRVEAANTFTYPD